MDFMLTEEQRELAGLTRRIVTDHAAKDLSRRPADTAEPLSDRSKASKGRFDRPLWSELAAAGLLDAVELGFLEQCSILIELGRAVAPVPYLDSIVVGASTLARFGTTDRQAGLAPQATLGKITLAAAIDHEGEPTAEKTGEGWVISGTFVVDAGEATVILVVIGDHVFLVDAQAEGVVIEEGRLRLTEIVLSGEQVLEGAAQWTRDRAMIGLCAHQLGVLERALEMTAAYAASRVQFGRAIGTFQAVTQRLADAYIDVEAIRLTMWQAAWRLAEGLDCATEIDTAKFWACDAGHRVAHTAVHIHGGVGIDLEYPLHKYFLAAKANEFALGHATEHLLRIGEALNYPQDQLG